MHGEVSGGCWKLVPMGECALKWKPDVQYVQYVGNPILYAHTRIRVVGRV
jgi:hypothetical protein